LNINQEFESILLYEVHRMNIASPHEKGESLLSGVGKTAVMLPATFLMSTANGLIAFGIVYYLRDAYSAKASVIGWFTAFYAIAYFLGCIAFKPLLFYVLPRYSMMVGAVVMGTSILGILIFHSLTAGFIFYGIFGFAVALFWPPLMGWLSANIEGKEMNRTMSRFNFTWSSANIAAPFLAGLLFEIDITLPIKTGIAMQYGVFLFILAASLVFERLRSDLYREPPRRKEEKKDGGTPVRYLGWIGIFCSYAIIGVLNTMFPLFGREVLSLSASVVGALLLTRALTTTAGFLIFGRTHRWHFKITPHYYAGAAYIFMAGLLILFPRPGAYGIILPLIGIIAAYSYSSSIFHGAAGTARKGKSMTIHEAILTAGQVFGAVGGGITYQYGGMTGSLVFLIVLIGTATVLQRYFHLRKISPGVLGSAAVF
jgi:MFS family permease